MRPDALRLTPAMSDASFPTGFVGHGNPMNALGGKLADAWRDWGASLPRPESILVVSAHFEASPPTLSSTTGAPVIHDFWGFPDELYRLDYPAPPAPATAALVERLLGPDSGLVRDEGRGLDHGAWVPLLHLFPGHDVPVVQLSIPWSDDAGAMAALGRCLAPVRGEGVFVLGSGNVVHNLRRVDWSGQGGVVPWADEFDGWVASTLESGWGGVVGYRAHPLAWVAHPTQEHFVPLLVAAAAAGDDPPSFPVVGFELGSISSRCIAFG